MRIRIPGLEYDVAVHRVLVLFDPHFDKLELVIGCTTNATE